MEKQTEKQTKFESACREKFIEDIVVALALSEKTRAHVVNYIRTEPGIWCQYNGKDMAVNMIKILPDRLVITFISVVKYPGMEGIMTEQRSVIMFP